MSHLQSRLCTVVATAGTLVAASSPAEADRLPQWSLGELVVEGAGCPNETEDGLSLMLASGRPGSQGLDIWVIDRPAVGAAWSEPKILPGPINSAAAEFCPSLYGRTLYFISTEDDLGTGCGGGDIHVSRQSPAGDWSEPVRLPCAPDGPNTLGTERSPSLIETWYGTFLFFSTNEGVADADEDIYVSIMDSEGEFGRGYLVHALSTPDHEDQMPTVRALGRTFEVTFNSDRPGTRKAPRIGGQDAYLAQTKFLPFWWSKPQNAGPNVNTEADETRASLSWDGTRLYVGRGNVYVSERQ